MLNFFKGLLIGIANIIPGVSGGTFALILGLYDRLINSMSAFDLSFALDLFKPRKFFRRFMENDGRMLLELVAGTAVSIVLLSWVIDYLLKFYPAYTLAFFMGLIIPSIKIPVQMIDKKSMFNAFFIIPGLFLVILSYKLTVNNPAPGLFMVFISGILAISAMILPGISGSFLLLVIGVYPEVVKNIKQLSSFGGLRPLFFLAVFGTGCLVGLVFFVRVMKLMLERYRDKTMFFLIGLVTGSLIVLWPFKNYPDLSSGKIDIAITTSSNIWPSDIKLILFSLVFFFLGAISVSALERIAKIKDK